MPPIPIGFISSVKGLDAEVEINSALPKLTFPQGDTVYRVGELGAYVTIPLETESLIGVVYETTKLSGTSFKQAFFKLHLVGTLQQQVFRKDFSRSPLLEDQVMAASPEEVAAIFTSASRQGTVTLGHLSQWAHIPYRTDLNKLLARHLAIVGNTGSGKSTTVATLIRHLLNEYAHPHIVVFDVHGEYGQMVHPLLKQVTPDQLKVPHWLLKFSQWQDLLTLTPPHVKSLDALKTTLMDLRMKFNPEYDRAKLTVDTPLYFRMMELLTHPKVTNDDFLNERLNSLYRDARYDPILKAEFDTLAGFADSVMDPAVGCTVLNLSHLVSELLIPIVEIFSTLFYELSFWNLERDFPLVLIYEEGHRYLNDAESSASSRKRIESLVKEGRKYGIAVVIVSQRPSDISETILAQCNNCVAHRLTTDRDQSFVKDLLPRNMWGLADLLPSLAKGEALMAGDAVPLPARVQIVMEEALPSTECDLDTQWRQGPREDFSIGTAADNWINQKFEWRPRLKD